MHLLTPISCRFTFVIAFLLLLTGAALNDQHGEESMYFGNYYCYVVKPGVFAGAAVLSLASVTLGILYYLTLSSAKERNDPWPGPVAPNQAQVGGGIAMGQPQFPPQNPPNQDPVFVHEDTYMRRQFTWPEGSWFNVGVRFCCILVCCSEKPWRSHHCTSISSWCLSGFVGMSKNTPFLKHRSLIFSHFQ